MAWKLNRTAESWALAQVRAGKINDGAWSGAKASASVPDDDVKGYMSKRWLGINPDGDPNNRGTYSYPFAIGDEVYTSAIRAIISAASDGRGAERNDDIANAARRILTEISNKKGRSAKEIKAGIFALSDIMLSEGTDSVPEWIFVMPFGKYKHPAGEFEITRDIAMKIIENFEKDPRDLVVDYEHQTLATENNGMPAPAMGWIKELELREDGIWGRVEWTETGREFVSKKEYRYTSPVYVPNYRDAKTGENIGAKVTSVALTNTPFFPDQAPIVSKDNNKEEVVMEKLIALAEKLGIELTDELKGDAEKLSKAIEGAIDKLAAKETQTETETETNEQDVEANENNEKDTSDDTAKMVAKLNTELAKTRKAIALREATDKVDKLIQDGKLLPVQRKWAVNYAMKDPQGFDEFAKQLPTMKVPEGIEAKDIGSITMEPVGDVEQVALKEILDNFGLSTEDWKKYKPNDNNETINI